MASSIPLFSWPECAERVSVVWLVSACLYVCVCVCVFIRWPISHLSNEQSCYKFPGSFVNTYKTRVSNPLSDVAYNLTDGHVQFRHSTVDSFVTHHIFTAPSFHPLGRPPCCLSSGTIRHFSTKRQHMDALCAVVTHAGSTLASCVKICFALVTLLGLVL